MKHKITLLDGAMGTCLQAAGLKAGEVPELLCFTDPALIESIHRRYIDAGSEIIYANTFGANPIKLRGSGHTAAETVAAAVTLAKKAANGRARVALDIGPTGQLSEPLGELDFDTAYGIFAEMLTAGETAGADLVVFETFIDLAELRAAVIAAKELTQLKIFATMSFDRGGRTFTGCTVASMAMTLAGLGVDAIGFNCSMGPEDILPLVKQLMRYTDKPVIVKPNAGLPDPETGEYALTASDFAEGMVSFAEAGVSFMGGCCGTTPEYISALEKRLHTVRTSERQSDILYGVCSPSFAVTSDGIRVIGERINPTGKSQLKQALHDGDMAYIQSLAVRQQQDGADILDINVGLPGTSEPSLMKAAVRAVQAVCDRPLQIDSSDASAVEAGLRYFCGKAIVNSVNGDPAVLDSILPLAKKYGAAVIGLTVDEDGVPDTAEKRFEIASRILDAAIKYGIPRQDVYIDCLTLTVSAQQSQAAETLAALRMIKEKLGLKTVLGVSNISFGLPERSLVTRTFLAQALAVGLDMPIINPCDSAVMDTVYACKVLCGQDKDCADYINHFANSDKHDTPHDKALTLESAVADGMAEEAAAVTERLLSCSDAQDIINNMLIPALDSVGERYEKGVCFLPQLIRAAHAANAAFEVIKRSIKNESGSGISRGRIILATVKGDIHDIGKNIVRVILENYGFDVIDLGKDVPKEAVLAAAKENCVKLVGLSALMTTTLSSMADTVGLLREELPGCRIMVGGAVLTAEYAASIGADYYAADAKEAADIAKEVFGCRE